MNGWILHAGEPAPELKRTVQSAAAHAVKLQVIDPKSVSVVIDADSVDVFVHGIPVAPPSFAIAGFVEEPDYYNLALLHHLETLGVLCVNTAQTLLNTGDKLRTHHLLHAQGIVCPKTVLVHPGMQAGDLLQHIGLPMVLKVLRGSKGQGVMMIKTRHELDNLLQLIQAGGMQDDLIAQQYVASSHGRDLRVLVVDRQPLVAMLRSSASAEQFKSNFSQGGSVKAWPLDDELRALSHKVIAAIGLNIGGIDLLFTDSGYLVCEVNSIPGFQGIESCHEGIDVPAQILRSIARQLAGRRRAPMQMRAFMRGLPGGESVTRRLAQAPDLERLQYFLGLCEQPAQTQEAVLLDIVRSNAHTEIGRRLGFDAATDVAAFRARVPVSHWVDYADASERLRAGEADLLFAGEVKHFINTSGTTGGVKYIPESEAGAQAKAVTGRLRTGAIMACAPSVLKGALLPLSNSPSMDTTAAGVAIGSASGLTLAAVPEEIRSRMAFPIEALGIPEQASLDYVLLRFALAQDVRAIVVNNAGRAEQLFLKAREQAQALIDDIAGGTLCASLALSAPLREKLQAALQPNPQRASELAALLQQNRFTPRGYWPQLRVFSCWLAGSVGRYTDSIRAYLPEGCCLFDCGYGASEGKFNVPLREETAAGPLALHAGFYEFVPLDGGEPLLAHQLKDQTAYHLLVTTYSGLYRYDLHDIVRVDGFTGATPNIQFESKSGEIANLAGEKVTAADVARAVALLPEAQRQAMRHLAVYPSPDERCYVFCIEARHPGALNGAELAPLLDAALRQTGFVYNICRGQELVRPARVQLMQSGWLDALYEARTQPGATRAQVKLPLILAATPEARLAAP